MNNIVRSQPTEVITSSSIRTWLTCRKKWWYLYDQKLRHKKKNKALTFGSLTHVALEAYFLGRDWEAAIDEFIAAEGDCWDLVNEQAYQAAMARALVSGYVKNGFWEMLGHEVIACEKKFEVPVKTPGGRKWSKYTFSGKIDMVTKDNYGNYTLWDFKTSAKALDKEWCQLDSQMEVYLWAYSQLNEIPAYQIVYSQLRKPTIKPTRIPLRDEFGFKYVEDPSGDRVWISKPKAMSVKDIIKGKPIFGKPRQMVRDGSGDKLHDRPETPAEYEERLNVDISRRPEHYYANADIMKSASDLDKIEARIWAMAHEVGAGFICTVSNSCQMYGCPYMELCISDNRASRKKNYEKVEIHSELIEEEREGEEDV